MAGGGTHLLLQDGESLKGHLVFGRPHGGQSLDQDPGFGKAAPAALALFLESYGDDLFLERLARCEAGGVLCHSERSPFNSR